MQELERRELYSALINLKCWLWIQLATATCYQPLICVNVAFYFYPRMIPKSIQMMPTNTFIWKLAEVISSWTIVHKIKLYTATSLIVTGVCSFCLLPSFIILSVLLWMKKCTYHHHGWCWEHQYHGDSKCISRVQYDTLTIAMVNTLVVNFTHSKILHSC